MLDLHVEAYMSGGKVVFGTPNLVDELVADRIVARLAGQPTNGGTSSDLRADIEALNDVTAQNVFERARHLPLIPDAGFQFKHMQRFVELAWKFYGGGGFYLQNPAVVPAYPLIFLTQHVVNNAAYVRAHGGIVTAYLHRALVAGKLDPVVLAATCGAHTFPDFTVEYLAHSDFAFNSYSNNLAVLRRTPRHANGEQAHAVEDQLAWAASIRLNLFQARWLPAAITPSEYAKVSHLQPGMLQELYPQVYEGGYELFYRMRQLHQSEHEPLSGDLKR